MQRATIVLDDEFVAELDRVIAVRGYQNRSEAIRDLARSGMRQAAEEAGAPRLCCGARLRLRPRCARACEAPDAFLPRHHDLSLSAMHVHLDHGSCLEVRSSKRRPRGSPSRRSRHRRARRTSRAPCHVPVEVEAEKHAHEVRPATRSPRSCQEGGMKRVDSPNISTPDCAAGCLPSCDSDRLEHCRLDLGVRRLRRLSGLWKSAPRLQFRTSHAVDAIISPPSTM